MFNKKSFAFISLFRRLKLQYYFRRYYRNRLIISRIVDVILKNADFVIN